jgi:hypothetical protein
MICPPRLTLSAEAFLGWGASVTFRLLHAQYDRETQRAYVELRDDDDDGGEVLAVAIFSFRTTSRMAMRQIEEDIVRKARHMFKKAAVGLDEA